MRWRMKCGALIVSALCILSGAPVVKAAWSPSTFLIGGYAVDLRMPADTTQLALMGRAGVDWVKPFGWYYSTLPGAANFTAALDLLRARHEGTALKVVATYSDPSTAPGRLAFNSDDPISLTQVRQSLDPTAGINSSASTLGWEIWDEPCGVTPFTNIGAVSALIDSSSLSRDRLAYVNVFGIHVYDITFGQVGSCYREAFGAGAGFSKEDGYRTYLNTYLSLFNGRPTPAPLLSFDHYPFQIPSVPLRDFFWNLRLIRDQTATYSRTSQRIPWQAVVQLSPYHVTHPDSTFPSNFSITNTRWQVYASLAYGAKGIAYWLLTPGVNEFETWGSGIFTAAGDTASERYSQVRALNKELHNLGPTLMKLDPVAVFHKDSLGWDGIADELFSSPERVYNIVNSFDAGSELAMVGYLKDRTNGDDYLLVFNKALVAPHSFSITLTNVADSLLRVDRATGAQILVGTNTSTISLTDLAPGQGELFRVLDQSYEYIPNVNVTAVIGDTTYYGHDRGIVMVARGTGHRIHHHDGTVFTPVTDLSISNTHVFAVQDNGSGGNVVRMTRDLESAVLFYNGIPRVRAVTAQEAESSIVIIDRLSPTTSSVKVFSSSGVLQTTLPFNDAGAPSTPWIAYDVHYQEGLGSFVVAHGRYYSRYLAKSPWTLLNRAHYRIPVPSSVRLSSLNRGTSQLLFAGRNEGTIGGVEKMDYRLTRPTPNGWWPAGGTAPSVKDVAAAGNHVIFCSTSPAGDFFVRLRALDLWALGYRSTSQPRSVGLTTDSIAFMANGPSVARSSQSGLAGRFILVHYDISAIASRDSVVARGLTLSLSTSPNPCFGRLHVRFTLPTSAFLELSVFDVGGRRVSQLESGTREAGVYERELKPAAKGIFFVRLRVGSETLRRKIVVM